jgi:hypothetical protein
MLGMSLVRIADNTSLSRRLIYLILQERQYGRAQRPRQKLAAACCSQQREFNQPTSMRGNLSEEKVLGWVNVDLKDVGLLVQ